jgi:hypothetical protein
MIGIDLEGIPVFWNDSVPRGFMVQRGRLAGYLVHPDEAQALVLDPEGTLERLRIWHAR